MTPPESAAASRRLFDSTEGGESLRLDRMTRLLRLLGATLLLASASTFLVQQWESGNDMIRYAFLLSHGLLLLTAALFCGGRLGESRSARIFLWTSLAMMPAFFAVLGGMVFSQFGSPELSASLPSYAKWEAPSRLAVLGAVLGTFCLTAPIAWTALRVLARSQAAVLLTTYLGLNTLFLIPVRSPDWIGAMSLAGLYLALAMERCVLAQDYAMRTLEGRLVRALLWVPPTLIALRTFILYHPTTLFAGLLILFSGICSLIATRSIRENIDLRAALEWCSSAIIAYGVLHTLLGFELVDDWGPLALLPSCLSFLCCAAYARCAKSSLEITASISACLIGGAAVLDSGTLVDGAIGLALGATVLASSVLLARWSTGAFGGLLLVLGARLVIDEAIGFERIINWGTLSAMGMALLLTAALFEKRRAAVLSWLKRRREEMQHDSVLS